MIKGSFVPVWVTQWRYGSLSSD